MRLLWFYLKTYFINHKQINITNNIKSNTYDKIKNIINLLKVISQIFSSDRFEILHVNS